MKKLFIVAVMAVFSITSINAQEATFGVKGGMIAGNFAGSSSDGYGGKIGFLAGGVVEIPLGNEFFIQPELLFEFKGAKSGNSKFNLGYISLPVVAKYYVIDGLSVEAGPQFGFLVSAKEKYNGGSDNISDELKTFDMGITFGAGYKLDNGLNFGLRFNPGIISIPKDFSGLTNSAFNFTVGYFFM